MLSATGFIFNDVRLKCNEDPSVTAWHYILFIYNDSCNTEPIIFMDYI